METTTVRPRVVDPFAGPPAKMPRLTCNLPIPKLPETTGTVFMCGQGDVGQLGLGEETLECKRPTAINSLKNVVDICAGGVHSLCLTKDGVIYSFGCNDEGALGRDTSREGDEFVPGIVDLPGTCVKMSAGDSHSACLLEDGRVFAWGSFRDSRGNMGLTLEGNKRFPIEVLPGTKCCDIASGADHLVILTCTGKVYTIGCGEQGQLGRVSLRSASGTSRRGKTQLLQPGLVAFKRLKYASAIWASSYCTFVKELGKPNIWAFGLNNYCQLGIKGLQLVTLPMISEFSKFNVAEIAGGQHHTIVLTEDRKCFAVGRGDYGMLGLDPITKEIADLTLIESLRDKNIKQISCGETQSFAITKEGEIYAWGLGSNLQLGTGSERDELIPVLIVSKQMEDTCAFKVSSGGQHTLFLAEVGDDSEVEIKIKEDVPNSSMEKSSTTVSKVSTTETDDRLTENKLEEEELVTSTTDPKPMETEEGPEVDIKEEEGSGESKEDDEDESKDDEESEDQRDAESSKAAKRGRKRKY